MTDRKERGGPLPPNATIGILGGGQLGRMLASSAAKLGFRTIVLEPQEDCPAAQLCNRQIATDYDDEAALAELASACDVVTYEFENVPLAAAEFLHDWIALFPPPCALEVSQDRIAEKRFLEDNGVPVAPFHPVSYTDDLAEGLRQFGGGVLKTCRFGYDGKGQHVFREGDDKSTEALETVLENTGASGNEPLWVLEKHVTFQREFSIVAARSEDGAISAFDAAENIHENSILRRSMAPASVSDGHLAAAGRHVGTILEVLGYVGVIGVEFFDTPDGVLVNEIAPRVHNTGHWTVEACATSQFDQHIRAITGLPLGDTGRLSDCEMINLLGDETASIVDYLRDPDTYVTLYGKTDSRPSRKMGHMTRLMNRRG